jgi:diguanylate cyclase (GGDEF)-like protein
MSIPAPVTPSVGKPPLPVLLGFAEGHDDRDHAERRLAQVAAACPLAGTVLTLALVATGIATGFSTPVLALALVAVLAFAGLTLCVGMRLAVPPCHRARGAAVAAGLLAVATLSLVEQVGTQSGGMMPLGAAMLLVGAIGLIGLAVQPVRGVVLVFGAGLVVAMAVMVGAALVWFEALALLGALALTMLRLGDFDRRGTAEQAEQAGRGRHAARMIAEFEGQGTGWFWETDRHGRITYLSARVAAEIAEHDPPPHGRLLTEIFRMDGTGNGPGAGPAGTERTLAFHLSSRTSFSDYPVCAAGDAAGTRWWSINGRPLVDELDRFQGFIGTGADLTELRRSEAEITRLALFDGLTGLANRQRMRQSLDKTLAQATEGHRPAGLMLMDLDRFKAVNDTLGHQAGDALLKQVAQRLQRGVGDRGLVGRMGGDEFKLLLPGIAGRQSLAVLADELIAALSQPYAIMGTSVTIGCSVGIAVAPDDGTDRDTLVRNADLALYAAKAAGRGVHRFYSADMLAGARDRQQLEGDLRAALPAGEFHLCYQPVVRTADAVVIGYEALIRWRHPVRGLVSPADFIPVAEECGLIGAIGEWVLRTACDEAARWPRDVRIAVNVSPVQFANPQLPGIVASALARSGLAAHRLELEITEGVFLEGSDRSDRMFAALKGLGVRLALDDFGTGYSSLGYLRTAPFDKIKIDQSFVRGAAQPGNRNAAIIRAIVMLADTLGMETTAEGVELQDEIELVRSLGCSHIQGYVYGRPAPAAEVAAALGIAGHAEPSGFRVSRPARTRLLRSARVTIAGRSCDVRVRDISITGAMVEGLPANGVEVDTELLIELVEGRPIAARISRLDRKRAGIRFAAPIDLSILSVPVAAIRRTA